MGSATVGDRLEHALRFAKEAGELTLRHFHALDALAVERKRDRSPVTMADREAELLLRRRINESFPEDSIVGEEFPAHEGTSAYRWILDPIDGTKSFICGVPLYGTLIGVQRGDRSELGVIELPGLDRRVYATVGGGAWSQIGDAPPTAARVRPCSDLREAVFVTTERGSFDAANRSAAYARLEQVARITRTWGDCYGYYLLATGRADIMIDPIMNVWDAAAILPIIQEAGGVFVDWRGVETVEGGDGIAASRELIGQVLELVSLP